MLIQFGWIERASATVNVLAPSEKGGAFMYEILIAESRLTKKKFYDQITTFCASLQS